MEILDYRPLIIALIEFSLGIYILYKGNFLKNYLALFLFFLGGYQLGEFFLIRDLFGQLGYQLAFFSTTLLPSIGILIIEKVSQKKLGFPIFFTIGMILGTWFIVEPNSVLMVEKCACFAKFGLVNNQYSNILLFWAIYYLVTLTLSIGYLFYLFVTEKNKTKKDIFLHIFVMYCLFYPFSYLLIVIFKIDIGYVISVMCSLGLLAGITGVVVSKKFKNVFLS